jgi:outer membrane cobalamin receptor
MRRGFVCLFLAQAVIGLPLFAPAQSAGFSLLAPSPDAPALPGNPGEFQRLELSSPVWPPPTPVFQAAAPEAPGNTQAAAAAPSSRGEVQVPAGQIQAQNPLSSEEVLATLPGADVQTRGPLGVQNDLTVNGSTFSQTLLLLDDLPLRDPQTGHNRLDLPLPPCELAGAGLLPGHASARFGSEAFGGTVNLATRPAGQDPGVVETFGGDFGTYGGQLRVPFATGGVGHTVSLNRVTTEGFRADTGADIFQAGYAARGELPSGPWKLRLGLADKNFGAAGYYAAYPSWEHTRTEFVSAQASYRPAPALALLPQFSFRRHEDFFILDAYRPGLYANQHLSRVSFVEVPAVWSLPTGALLRLGIEGCQENLDSSNLGARTRSLASGYAFFQSPALGQWVWDAGLRLDTWDSQQRAWSPSLGCAYGLSERWKLRAGAGQAFRLPDFTELYYQDPGNQGNPGLAPEKAWAYELGLDGRPSPGWQSQVTVFRRDEFDVIDWTRAAGTAPWQAGNISRLTVTGLTALARWAQAGFEVQTDYSLLSLQSGRDPALASKYQFNFPAHKFQVQAGYAGRLAPWVHAAYVQRLQGAGVWLLDAVLRYRATEQTTIFVKVTNALNAGYEEIPGVPQPGRWLLAGVEMKFL